MVGQSRRTSHLSDSCSNRSRDVNTSDHSAVTTIAVLCGALRSVQYGVGIQCRYFVLDRIMLVS